MRARAVCGEIGFTKIQRALTSRFEWNTNSTAARHDTTALCKKSLQTSQRLLYPPPTRICSRIRCRTNKLLQSYKVCNSPMQFGTAKNLVVATLRWIRIRLSSRGINAGNRIEDGTESGIRELKLAYISLPNLLQARNEPFASLCLSLSLISKQKLQVKNTQVGHIFLWRRESKRQDECSPKMRPHVPMWTFTKEIILFDLCVNILNIKKFSMFQIFFKYIFLNVT